MELRYVVLTIIKILISVPAIFFFELGSVNGAALMGGHLDNNSNSTATNLTEPIIDYEGEEGLNNSTLEEDSPTDSKPTTSEEIPDPSALVLPGYNLPENIFNKGKPFYLEKDPLTGKIDFDTKLSTKLDDDLYDYVDDQPINDNIYDKSNIDRKDGSIGHSSHKPSDVNQLTPNFHDFLNLPVKYNSDKYVYPLISSSYANTKIQGNVNRYHNHKDYNVKTSTHKPTGSPTYYSSTKNNNYFNNQKSSTSTTTTTTRTTTQPSTTTTTTTQQIYLTSKVPNLMSSPINHPSFSEDFADYYDSTTSKTIYLTTKNYNDVYITTPKTTTTKRPMSLFEQLFGDYDETVTTTQKTVPTFNKNTKNKQESESKTEKPSYTTPNSKIHHPNSHAGNNNESESYEYEEYIDETTTSSSSTTTTTTPNITTSTSTTTTTMKVTSLPLGENHVTSLNNHQPIIIATQNLRDKLNAEMQQPRPFEATKPSQKPPSTSNIHIAPDQDTVSFVVGHHQNVEGGGQYVGTSLKESPYDSNPFRPLYGDDQVSYTVQTSAGFNYPSPSGSAVTIQPLKNSEASLAIGVPINDVNQVKPGQVVDAKLELDNDNNKNKIRFPSIDDEKLSQQNREVLKLNSKPMYHQLPSDLTPPKESVKEVIKPPRVNLNRPPWDPRPGHFYSGKPEYNRPPRPELASYKRIDNLPNILPQFRPNFKHYSRQPLLERPNNRPIGFFEKLQPPPPPKNLQNLRKIPQLEAEERIINIGDKVMGEQLSFYQTPPKPVLANRRIANLESDVETLQMIQAKKSESSNNNNNNNKMTEAVTEKMKERGTDKPLYVVYPVNTPPIKLDVIDSNTKESVVIGTRAELPLPPSKINKNYNYNEQNPIFKPKERHDSPILRPHPRPPTPTNSNAIKSDFPYPLERPDLSANPSIEAPSNNKLEDNEQISATLKTYTEKPIAVAYTPTEPHPHHDLDKYSMPNLGSPVIPEIRPGSIDDVGKPDSEFTVSAVMHTHPQENNNYHHSNHRSDTVEASSTSTVYQEEFQAPFQASVSVDSLNQGWSVVRDKSKSSSPSDEEVTALPLATTSEFDIENFKPELIGGFKPIYNYPEDASGKVEANERKE